MKKLTLTILLCLMSMPAFAAPKESAFDRIIRTGVLRCGYYVFPPVTYRDPNTNELSGFTVDMMNEFARRAELKIEWTEETSFENWVPGLQAGRYDVACTPNWPSLPMSRAISFSVPLFYAGLYPMVRKDDPRFTGNSLDMFRAEGIIFSMADGDNSGSALQVQFPKAKFNVMPPGSGNSAFVLEVIGKKADAFLTDNNGKIEFEKAYPGKLKFMDNVPPIKLQPFNIAVERSELILNDFINAGINDLIYDGTMDMLLRKWEPEPGKTFLRVAKPYEDKK